MQLIHLISIYCAYVLDIVLDTRNSSKDVVEETSRYQLNTVSVARALPEVPQEGTWSAVSSQEAFLVLKKQQKLNGLKNHVKLIHSELIIKKKIPFNKQSFFWLWPPPALPMEDTINSKYPIHLQAYNLIKIVNTHFR